MAEESCNFIVRLYRGDVSLPVTFWVFYFVLCNVAYFIPVVNFIYWVFATLAVWNSAGKYEGLALWRVLCQIIAGISIIAIVLGLVLTVLAVISAG